MNLTMSDKLKLLLSSAVLLSIPFITLAATANSPASITVSNPVLSQAAVMSVAQNAALAVFNYDYQNYNDRLKMAAMNFTPAGWASYTQALQQSGNIAVMQQHQVTMVGHLTGTASVTQLTNQNNAPQWLVQMPMQVIYTSSTGEKIIHNLIVKVTVTTVDSKTNPNGLAVTQIIAAPNVNQ